MAMPGGVDMGAILSDQLMKAAAVVEDQIDAEMAKMQKLPDEDELEVRIWNIYSAVLGKPGDNERSFKIWISIFIIILGLT